MSDGLYIGMTGAAARAEQLDSVADNLANIQTPGFKAARPAFESFFPPGGAQDKVYSAAVSTGIDTRAGRTIQTGNALDVTPQNNAFLAVKQASGELAYTRAGRLSVNAQGQLIAAGFPLVDRQQKPILIPPGATPSIDANGQVRANGQVIGQLGIFRLSGPVNRIASSLFSPATGTPAVAVKEKLQTGTLEMSNFQPIEAAVALIDAHRHYDTSIQALQTYRRMDERAVEVGRVR